MLVEHTLEPIYDKNSKVLILGSIPSLKSREVGFYYSHKKIDFGKLYLKSIKKKFQMIKKPKLNF